MTSFFHSETKPVFLPDIDLYFKRNMASAYSLVDGLADAGCKYIKGALLHNAEICFDGCVTTSYLTKSQGLVIERYRSIVDRHILPLSECYKLYSYAKSVGMDVVLSVYDNEGIAFALDLGAKAIKIPSSLITHIPLIRQAGSSSIPLLIDTGRASLTEISQAVDCARQAGVDELVIQHSPPAPPSPVCHHNLNMMLDMGNMFDCEFGLSDHHAGDEMLLAATALGAKVLEKGGVYRW